MQRLRLSLPSLGERQLLVRQLDGHAERLAEPDDPHAASALLAAVLAEPPEHRAEKWEPVFRKSDATTNNRSGVRDSEITYLALAGLYPSWRDRVLAALFEREFGNRIDSEGDCSACGAAFAFAFGLDAILAAQDVAAQASGLRLDREGLWRLDDGGWIRPPTIGDLAAHPDPAAMLAAHSHGIEPARAEALLEAGAPLLAVDLETSCPQCGAASVLGFEISDYLLRCLAGERPLLLREIHLIASSYGWSHESILALPRGERRAFAHLVVGERSAATLRRAV